MCMLMKLDEIFLRIGGDKIMVAKRDIYKYHFKIGNEIVHSGITNDLERREMEHKQKWPNRHIFQIGNKTTEEGATNWEEKQKKA